MRDAHKAPAAPSRGMSQDPIARFIEGQDWLPSPESETTLQLTIIRTLDKIGGRPLRAFLHGDWLHEPLHSVLTDVPIGSWTVTITLDALAAITGSEGLDTAADSALAVGLVGALGAAVTGWNDWSEVDSPAARRIGLTHGLLNVAAVTLYATSFLLRRRHKRSAGRWLATLGYGVISLTAHLGGNLVYEHGIGVSHRPGHGRVTENMRGESA